MKNYLLLGILCLIFTSCIGHSTNNGEGYDSDSDSICSDYENNYYGDNDSDSYYENEQDYENVNEEDNNEEDDPVGFSSSYSAVSSSANDYDENEFDNYEETSSCVNGVAVYEGRSDYFVVETTMGYTILEVYSGILYEGDNIRGELNRYSMHYIINKRTKRELRVYIEDYMLSKQSAIEWMAEHDKLKYSDQENYSW